MSKSTGRQERAVSGSDLILALVSAVLGVIVAAWLSSRESAAPTWILFLTLVMIVALIAMLVSKTNALSEQLRDIRLEGLSNVRTIAASEISQLAAELVATAHTIRVVGTARQDIISTDETARKYLEATERRLKTDRRLYYRRITSSDLRPSFASHLGRVLTLARKSDIHDVQVAIAESLDYAISYQIFDDTTALLIVDAPTVPGVRDNVLAFLIKEGSMVAALIAHFDNAWLKRNSVVSIQL